MIKTVVISNQLTNEGPGESWLMMVNKWRWENIKKQQLPLG